MRRSLLILFACIIGVCNMLQITPTYAQNTCTVTGTVKDGNGGPIVGAIVIVFTTDNQTVVATAVTDVTGHYTMSVPKEILVNWRVSAIGYVQAE